MFVNKKPKSKVLALVLGASLLGPLACNDNHFQPGAMTKDEPSVAQPESRDAAAAQPPTPIPDSVLPEPTPEDPIVVPLPAATVALETSRKPDTTINSFASSAIKDSSIKFSLSPKGISSNFTLSDIISPRSDSFTQLTRTSLTDSFKQGNPGQPVSQSFAQNARKGLVDILVVIDNSGSMGEEQKGLSTKLNELLVSVKDSNWQLSVINTSPVMQTGYTEATEGKEVCTTTLIKSGEADASTKFAAAINAGLTGTGNEQGIRQAVVGLRCTEKPWVRPGSTLAVLIVSDEDNCSDGTGCGSLPWANESYLSNYVENTMKRTIGKDAGFFGIVSPSKALCATQGNTATQYMKLFAYKSTSMNYGNICDADYKPTLNRISDSIALLLDAKFEIQSLPDAGSLSLTLMLKDGSKSLVPASNYMLSGKTIEFKAGMEPPASSTIIANYLVGAKPILTSFPLSQDPALDTLQVKVNGVMQAASSYSISGRSINFSSAPASFADLIIDYRQNTPLLNRFKLNGLPVANSLKVLVNSAAATGASFDASKNEVILSNIPKDGQKVDVSYLFNEGPQLSYTLPIASDAFNVKILDQAAAVGFVQTGNVFKINAASHKPGKVLTLVYEVSDASTKSFDLGQTPIAGSSRVAKSAGSCDLGAGLEIQDDKLISSCRASAKIDFDFSYKYVELIRRFVVMGVDKPDLGTWAVFVDGKAVSDFTRVGSIITLTGDLNPNSRVEIQHTAPE